MTNQFDNLRELLHEISYNADHIIGTEAKNHKEVALQDAEEIKNLSKQGYALLDKAYRDITLANQKILDQIH